MSHFGEYRSSTSSYGQTNIQGNANSRHDSNGSSSSSPNSPSTSNLHGNVSGQCPVGPLASGGRVEQKR